MLDLADLRIFLAVVSEGGVLKAARKLHRVPSSITTRIQRLEASTGVQLFHRHKQRLHLSPGGELLQGYAEKLLRLSDEASSAARRLGAARRCCGWGRSRARPPAGCPRCWRRTTRPTRT